MAVYADNYSRLVAWLKIILPIVALALMSMLFLLAKPSDPVGTVPYADVDIDTIVSEQRISEPTYAGVTSDGSSILVRAEQAKPNREKEDALEATELRARINLTDGPIINLEASSGQIDSIENQIDFSGGVNISTSGGIVVSTLELSAGLESTSLESTGEISGYGPFGSLTAGKMKLTPIENGAHVLVFQDGVRLIYTP